MAAPQAAAASPAPGLGAPCTAPDAEGRLAAAALGLAAGGTAGPAVLLCEAPAASLARQAALGPCDAGQVLDAWCTSARRLMHATHRAGGDTVLLDVADAAAVPAAAWRLCSGGAPPPEGLETQLRQALPDAVALAVAGAEVIGHARAQAVWAELQASCRPLPGAAPATGTPALALWHERHAAATHAALELAQRRHDEAALRARLTEAERRLAQLEDDWRLIDLMHRQAIDDLAAAGRQAAQLEAALRSAQDERDAARAQGDAERAQRADAELAQTRALAERDATRQELEHLRQQLAQQLAQQRADAERLQTRRADREAELRVCRQELATAQQESASLRDALARAQQQAGALQQALDAAAQGAAVDRAATAEARAERDRSIEAVRAQAAQLAELERHREELQRRLELLPAAHAQALSLHESELQRLRSALDEAGRRQHADAQAAAALRAAIATLQRDTGSVQLQLDDTVSQLRAREADLHAARADGKAWRAKAERAQAELQRLIDDQQHVQQQAQRRVADADRSIHELHLRVQALAQEARQHELLHLQALEELRLRLPPAEPGDTWRLDELASLSLESENPDAPHRELQMRVELEPGWPVAAPVIGLRLVEHLGRVGFVFLADAEHAPPLHAWRPEDEHDGRSFMRLIPTDSRCAPQLALLPPADWRLLNGLAQMLARRLPDLEQGLHYRWSVAAARLATQLRRLPARLRYSALQVVWLDEPHRLRLVFGDVLFGSEDLGDLTLEWHLRSGALLWRHDPQRPPALAAWPVGDDGLLAPSMDIAVGSGVDRADKARWWAELGLRDRELLLALLDALPAAAQALQEHPAQATVQSRAAALHREARRRLGGMGMKSRLRRLLSRPTT